MFAPEEIFRLSLCLLAVALSGGICLWMRTGMPLFYIGVGGLLCSVFYPALKYHALGDAVILMAYSLLPTVGTVYAATLQLDWRVLYLALPIGLITDAILHCNNTRDIETDRRAGIRTLALGIGGRASVYLYYFELVFPFLWISGCVAGNVLPVWCLLAWVAFIPTAANVRRAIGYFKAGPPAIANLDEATARLQLLFSLFVALSLIIAGNLP